MSARRIEKTVSASVLLYYYSEFSSEYDGGYPDVVNPSALIEGTANVMTAIGDGRMYDTTLLYIVETDEDRHDPRHSKYVLSISRGGAGFGKRGFAVRLFYSQTGEVESISTFEESRVVWSPDNMDNTKHPNRTKCYLGFVYMLCDKSPGFDSEAAPENELTGEDLIAMGLEGELPPELIKISVPDGVETNDEKDDGNGIEEDDTEVIIESPEKMEEEFDDLETDYAELFE